MYFSGLLATLALAPAVYGYGIAQVQVNAHDDCPIGHEAQHTVKKEMPAKVFPTKDSCPKVKVLKGFDIDTYSFSVEPITPDTFETCHGLAIYANEECVGVPDFVVPFHPRKNHAQSPCLPEIAFEKYVSLTLLCEEGHHRSAKEIAEGKAHEGTEHHDEDEHEEDHDEEEHVEHEPKQQAQDHTQHNSSPLGSLGF
ncbi:hypothetical protein BDV25DRAFT_136451 [Aspergillus avenaceus]|uniref:Uncharacterized protein n=1 Tax=Aspergillus avenaceus TaxID=36643 RepID=A0A5N6U5H0_ASPAV|nr:hypothetical protein BDV25DRAFT_136451 [Aspergillus avenaceus]